MAGAAALLVLGAAAYLARTWLWERLCLFRLEMLRLDDAKDGSRWPLIVELYERKCVEVTPHLLAWYRSHPIARKQGIMGMATETQAWRRRLWTVERLGPAVAPHLAERLDREQVDSWEAVFLLDALRELGPDGHAASQAVLNYAVRNLEQEQRNWNREALETLWAMGDRALPQVHALVRSCWMVDRQRGQSSFCTDILMRALPDLEPAQVVPLLDDLLSAGSWLKNDDDCYPLLLLNLGRLGPEAQKAIPLLEQAFQSDELRSWAALALAAIDPRHAQALAYLERELADPTARPSEWIYLVQRLRFVRATVPQLLPHLVRGLEVDDLSEPEVVVLALFELDPDFAVATLLALLNDRRPRKRLLAIDSLVRVERLMPDVLEKLTIVGNDPDEAVAWAAASALATARQTGPEALDLYTRRFGNGSRDGAGDFPETFGRFAASHAQAKAVLIRALSAGGNATTVALDVISRMGSFAAEHLPRVEALLTSADADLAARAKEVLASHRVRDAHEPLPLPAP